MTDWAGGVNADHANTAVAIAAPDLIALAEMPPVTCIWPEYARDQIEEGKIVIARDEDAWCGRQAVHECDRGAKLATPGTLRDVTRQDNQIRRDAMNRCCCGSDDAWHFGTEMRVGQLHN